MAKDIQSKQIRIEIIRGDAFQLIKQVESNSIDLVFTDPPYKRATQVKLRELTNMQIKIMAKEFARVLKKGGNLALFCGMYDKWDWYQALKEAGLNYIMELLWVYRNPSTIRFQKRKFVPAHDTILWFSKGEEYYFDERVPIELSWFEHKAFVGKLRGQEGVPSEKLNTTPKPLKIAIIIVKRLCPLNGIVLDPFAGLGTFAIACKLTNRNYLGFEINEKYFHIVLDRIKKYNIQNDLFLEVDSDV